MGMDDVITLESLESNLPFFNLMYDAVRLVNPGEKTVIEFRSHVPRETDAFCYEYWGRKTICENCISYRAYREHKSYFKIEHMPEQIKMVVAIPIQSAEGPLVLELLKDVTDSMLIGEGNYRRGTEAGRFLQRLNGMLMKDKLTGLYNRRFADERLPVDIIQAGLHAYPLSVLFLDVNRMKNINDVYGHSAGDLALKTVARTISRCIRKDSDWAARYGGDEIILCLSNMGKEDADLTAERIRGRMKNTPVHMDAGEFFVTVSVGVCTMSAEKLTAAQMVERADREMYQDKQAEKN